MEAMMTPKPDPASAPKPNPGSDRRRRTLTVLGGNPDGVTEALLLYADQRFVRTDHYPLACYPAWRGSDLVLRLGNNGAGRISPLRRMGRLARAAARPILSALRALIPRARHMAPLAGGGRVAATV